MKPPPIPPEIPPSILSIDTSGPSPPAPGLRLCPDCRSAVSKKAPACPKCGRPMKSKQYGCSGCLAIGVLLLIILAAIGHLLDPEESKRSSSSGRNFRVGDNVVLYSEGAKGLFIAMTDDSWDELMSAKVSGNPQLLMRLLEQGKALFVENSVGATVVKTGFTSTYIRLRDGDFAGREGWIEKERVYHEKRD